MQQILAVYVGYVLRLYLAYDFWQLPLRRLSVTLTKGLHS